MRGIPKKIATREDVYNLAMDLPPDAALKFLKGLTPKKVKKLLTAEDLTQLKERVKHCRFEAELAADKKKRVAENLRIAKEKLIEVRRDYDHAVIMARAASGKLAEARDAVKQLENEIKG